MNATYGYTPQSPQDKWLKAAQEEVEHAVQAGQPAGAYPVFKAFFILTLTFVHLAFLANFIPALKHLPAWLPGMGWKTVVNEWRAHKEYTTSGPYKWAKEQIVGIRYECECCCANCYFCY